MQAREVIIKPLMDKRSEPHIIKQALRLMPRCKMRVMRSNLLLNNHQPPGLKLLKIDLIYLGRHRSKSLLKKMKVVKHKANMKNLT